MRFFIWFREGVVLIGSLAILVGLIWFVTGQSTDFLLGANFGFWLLYVAVRFIHGFWIGDRISEGADPLRLSRPPPKR